MWGNPLRESLLMIHPHDLWVGISAHKSLWQLRECLLGAGVKGEKGGQHEAPNGADYLPGAV